METLELSSDLFKEFLEGQEVIFSYTGPFNDDLLQEMTFEFEGKLSDDLGQKDFQKIFPIFVEQVQNVVRYSSSRGSGDKLSGIGIVIISKDLENHHIISANPIQSQNIQRLQTMFDHLNQTNKEELKALYKERRKSGPDQHSLGGAGLGIIDMFRKSAKPVEYKIQPLNPAESLFCYKVSV